MVAKDVEAGRAHVIISLRDRVTGALKHVERSVAGFGRNFATLGAAVSAGSGAALAFPLKLAADMERTGIGFEVLLGSADAAKKMLGDLATFAKNTPFTLDSASKNAQMLLAYGVSANQVLPNLKALGDVALGDEDKFNRLTLAFGQVMSKGRLMGQEVLQMTEAGFNPLQEISRTTGISVAELSKRMEDGQISAGMLAAAFQSTTGPGGRFQNGMEKLQKSAWGMLSTLIDAVAFGLRPIGDAAIAVLKPLVTFATQVSDAFGAFAAQNQWLTKAVAVTLISLFAVGAALTGIGLAAIALSTAFGGLAIISGAAASVLAALFSPIGLLVTSLVLAIVLFRSQIAAAFSTLASIAQPVIDGLSRIWAIFQQTFGGILAALMSGNLQTAAGIAWLGFVAAAWQGVSELGKAIAAAIGFLQAWIPGVDSVASYVGSVFRGMGQAILAGRWDLAASIAMAKIRLVVTEGWNAISSLWSGFSVVLGETWDSAVHSMGTVWNTVVGQIAGWLLSITNGVANLIDRLQTEFQVLGQLWNALWSDEGQQAAVEAITKLRSDMESRAAARSTDGQRALQEDQARRQQEADRARAARSQARYAAGADQIAAGDARAKQIRDQIAALEGEAAQAYQSAGAPTIEDAAAKAKADLEAAVAAANEKTEESAVVQQMAGLASNGVQQLGKVASFGTFSAAGAGALALGFDSDSQQATARNTKRLVTLAERQRQQQPQFG